MEGLNSEQLEELSEKFESLKLKNIIEWDDLQAAFKVVGVALAGHELRELAGTTRKDVNIEAFKEMYIKAKDMKNNAKAIQDALRLKHDEDVKSFVADESYFGAHHSVSTSEERGFTAWINQRLINDKDLKTILPINTKVEGELYKACENGILLCKMVNVAQPETIDERSINGISSLKNVFKVNENLSLAVNSAAAIGCCVVNIGPDDIKSGKRHIVLGLIWQLIRRGIIDTITLNKHSNLVCLLKDGETVEDLALLKPEEMLMRWVNYHLQRSGCDKRISNFDSDLADSVAYSYLLEQIAPESKRESLTPASSILQSSSNQERAEKVLKNATKLEVPPILAAEDIYMAGNKDKENKYRLNLTFLATLFNLYPGLDENTASIEIEPETLEEKTYRNWMNSLGVDPYVTHLYTGLSNGLVPLQLVDNISPGKVDWSLVVQKFDPKKQLFQEQSNCDIFIKSVHAMNIPLVNVGADNIRTGTKTLVLGTCFQLIQAYLYKLLLKVNGGKDTPASEKDVLQWVNTIFTAAKQKPLSGFRDKSLLTGKPVLQFLELIQPNSTDKSIWMDANNKDDDFSTCQYAISCCRKAGACVYTLPEHLRDLNGKMILTLFLCLQILYFSTQDKK